LKGQLQSATNTSIAMDFAKLARIHLGTKPNELTWFASICH